MGQGPGYVDHALGDLTWGPSGSTGGITVLTWASGPSGVHALAQGKRPRRKRVSLSVTYSGPIADRERATADELYDLDTAPRPATYGECMDMPRPCPYVSCRHHMYLHVTETGSVQLRFGEVDLDELPYTCSLDAAFDGPMTLEEVGEGLAFTKERVRQIETGALVKVKAMGMSPTMLEASLIDWQE
jgi:hypothetical protein